MIYGNQSRKPPLGEGAPLCNTFLGQLPLQFWAAMIGRNEVLQLTGRHPRPLMDFETRFLLQDLSGGDLGGIRECNKRLIAFNAAWARLQSDEPGWLKEPSDRSFDRELRRWLTFHQAMLVGELILLWWKFSRTRHSLRASRQNGGSMFTLQSSPTWVSIEDFSCQVSSE